MVILNLFWKIHVVKIWLIINVNEFIRAGLTNFNNGEETPSKPQKLNMFYLWDCAFVWLGLDQYW